MKKQIIRLFSLTLASLMLFGCSQSNTSQTDDKSSISINNSTDDTDNSDSSSVSETSESSSPDISGDENDPDWIKGEGGFETFTYKRDEYELINYYSINGGIDPLCSLIERYDESDELTQLLRGGYRFAVKVRPTGDSYYYRNGYCGSICATDNAEENGFSGLYTPVVVEEIIYCYKDKKPSINIGDVIYVSESYVPNTLLHKDQNPITITETEKLESDIEILESKLQIEKDKGENANNSNYKADLEKTIETYKERLKISKHNDECYAKLYDKSIIPDLCYPMEKGKSYLIYIAPTPRENIIAGPELYQAHEYKFCLSDENPDSYGDFDKNIPYYADYELFWNKTKEQYGEYFK